MYFYSVLDSEPRNNKSLIRLFEHNGSSVASQEKLDLMHVPRRELLLREKKDKWLLFILEGTVEKEKLHCFEL